jgi:hypothetical protein
MDTENKRVGVWLPAACEKVEPVCPMCGLVAPWPARAVTPDESVAVMCSGCRTLYGAVFLRRQGQPR